LVALPGTIYIAGIAGLNFGHEIDALHALKKFRVGDTAFHEMIEGRVDGGLLLLRHELI
jgi:hypothetical protein